MKKLCIFLAACMLAVSFTACGNPLDSETVNHADTESAQEGDHAAVTVDENLLTVDITLPASMFEDETDIDLDAYAKDNGFEKAVMNDDGSMTITMTKSKHKEILSQMTATLEEGLSELIESENAPYIKAINHSTNFDTVTVDVDKNGYEDALFDLTPFAVGMGAMTFQMYTGDTIRVEVIMRDVDTKETISSTVYPDDLKGVDE